MRWALTQVDPPKYEPISLDDVKLHLRVDGSEEDAWIYRGMRAAREYCEEVQGRAYVTQRYRLTLERWPCGQAIYLPKPPLQAVKSIAYTLADGTVETLDESWYIVDTDSEPGAIHLAPGVSWPSGQLMPGMPIRIEYTAGYGAAEKVPERVKQAMLLLIAHWYENREAVVVGAVGRSVELAVDALLGQDRFWYSGPEVA